nr:immunoglobulin light chain junction region [Macaca mulatta]
FQQHNSYPLTF